MIKSFKAALNGFAESLIKERNFKIMAVFAAAVVFLMFYFPTSRLEKVALLITIFSVLLLELINTAVERIMDFLEPQEHEKVRIIKDLMAAVVLVACAGSVIVGLVIFWPYL